ncbi:MAG TPA: putative Ig domain-containing protein, partial [Noviherbaspirillum sp.]|nr:putative Ig domain-containing protein [Noviherbaspirillum sp.]
MSTEVQTRTAFPYSAIVLVITTFPDGTRAAGTGTVVGVNDVLTATHVLYSPNNGGWASKVEVYPGADFNGTTSRIEDAPINLGNFTWEVKGWPTQAFANADHNTFSSSESQYDVAVLGLSTPLGVQTGWYGIASGYDNSQWASVLGYSSDATGMMSGSAYVVRDPSASLYFTASANPSDLLSHGSSGGPLYITGQDGKPYVIGVKSAGTSTSNIWADIGLLYDQVKAEISRNDILLTAPYVSQPVADQDATVGQAFKLALASDIFTGGGGSGSLTYSAKLTTGAALPSWLHFDPATKTFSGTPSLADQNTIGIRVTATGINGASASDEFLLSIGAFGTRLAGTAQNDLLRGGADNDYIDGGQGIDTLVLEGPRANYQTTVSGNTTVLKHLSGSGGADTLTSVERLRFADVSVALDVSGTGGQAYRLYQAAFNRAPDASGFGV